MEKIFLSCKKDESLIKKGIIYNTLLFTGKDETKFKFLYAKFLDHMKKIKFIEQDKNNLTYGYTKADKDGNYTIELLGFKNAVPSDENKISHCAVHEFHHALQYVATNLYRDRKLDYIDDNMEIFSFGGKIVKEFVKSDTADVYSIFFCETLSDILTLSALLHFDFEYSKYHLTMDDVLNNRYEFFTDKGVFKNRYSKYISLGRLAICAFLNNPNIKYGNLIKNGKNIITYETKDNLGNNMYLNDFIYGITCDTKYLEKLYNDYMGEDAYYELCKDIDMVFTLRISKDVIKKKMISLMIFRMKRINDLKNKNMLSEEDGLKLMQQFNIIFSDMLNEYSIELTEEDKEYIMKESFNIKQQEHK